MRSGGDRKRAESDMSAQEEREADEATAGRRIFSGGEEGKKSVGWSFFADLFLFAFHVMGKILPPGVKKRS
jgi:hypothetical protein